MMAKDSFTLECLRLGLDVLDKDRNSFALRKTTTLLRVESTTQLLALGKPAHAILAAIAK